MLDFRYSCARGRTRIPDKVITSIDFERGPSDGPAPFCLAITCDDDPTPLPPEKFVLGVKIVEAADTRTYAVTIDGSQTPLINGWGKREILLASGIHNVEVRDGDVAMRRGVVEAVAGGWNDISVDRSVTLFPLPSPQPAARARLVQASGWVQGVARSNNDRVLATAWGNGTLVLWEAQGTSFAQKAVLQAGTRAFGAWITRGRAIWWRPVLRMAS